MAVIELCPITPEVQELITDRASVSSLRTKAIEQGMIPMRDYGWQKVISGDTTIEEVIAVSATYHTS
jgi:general secretion pathway protein E